MKITEICFTCGGHAKLASDMDNPRPGVKRVWVVDAIDEEIKPPAGVEVWVIPFDRGGNLRGWPCIQGELGAFKRAFDEGADVVIKRDSDTRVSSDAVMCNFGDMFAIFVRKATTAKLAWAGFGAAYSLRPDSMPILKRAADLKLYTVHDKRVPEDEFFSFTLFAAGVLKLLPITAVRFTRNSAQWARPENVTEAWVNSGNKMDLTPEQLASAS